MFLWQLWKTCYNGAVYRIQRTQMNFDVQTFVITAVVLAGIGFLLALFSGIRSIQSGLKLDFYRKRRDLIVRGWRLIFFSVGLVGLAFLMNRFAEPMIYTVYPPSPTVTQTATITLTPTITLTSTITLTPTITETPSVTNTPSIPTEVFGQFSATTQPNPNSVFSDVVFALEIDNNLPVDPAAEFANPIQTMYGTFSYDQMTTGSQWSAVWYRLGDTPEIVCVETMPWDGSTGGYGYTECATPKGGWLAGEYETQIFVGPDWKSSGRFNVTGTPPTPLPTVTPTRTTGPSPTATPRPPTATSLPTWTLPPTLTPSRTPTRYPTWTPLPTGTATRTPLPTRTFTPTFTRRPTDTRWPTLTPLFRITTTVP